MAELQCRVGFGVMSHERALFIDAVHETYESWADPSVVTVIEQEDLLPHNQALGMVNVRIVSDDPSQDRVLVELPCEVVMGGRRIWVPRTSLR